MTNPSLQPFYTLSRITLILVVVVIIAGSVVRATGSGMGCPDWPKCFGQWIPPTDASELPADYQQRYAGEHHNVEPFNAAKTWTEYLNRLAGVLLGFAVFAQMVFSYRHRLRDRRIMALSVLVFVLVGIQGWLGAKVVSSNLAPVKITLHMLLALVILAVAIAIVYRVRQHLTGEPAASPERKVKALAYAALFCTILQIMLGTQVREHVDMLVPNFDDRHQVMLRLGTDYILHRSFAFFILALNGWMVWLLMRSGHAGLFTWSIRLASLLLAEVVAGVGLAWLGLSPVLQPVHLLLATLVFAVQFWIILVLYRGTLSIPSSGRS